MRFDMCMYDLAQIDMITCESDELLDCVSVEDGIRNCVALFISLNSLYYIVKYNVVITVAVITIVDNSLRSFIGIVSTFDFVSVGDQEICDSDVFSFVPPVSLPPVLAVAYAFVHTCTVSALLCNLACASESVLSCIPTYPGLTINGPVLSQNSRRIVFLIH